MSDQKVTFIGIGGQKCASTWIYDILADHPEVVLSRAKELDFFSNYWDRGFGWYSSQFDRQRMTTARAVGEVSPSYLSDTDAPSRAAQYNRDMRIILTLRNPVDRAYSNHKHNIRQGFVKNDDLSFERGLADNPTYLDHGHYGRHLSNWLNHFPREQVLLIFFEDIVSQPAEVAASVYRFLGVSDEFVSPSLHKKSNESAAVANVRLALLIDKIRIVINSSAFAWIWSVLGMLGLRKLYRFLNTRNVETSIPRMTPESRSQLVNHFREDTQLLEALSGRSLSSWQK